MKALVRLMSVPVGKRDVAWLDEALGRRSNWS